MVVLFPKTIPDRPPDHTRLNPLWLYCSPKQSLSPPLPLPLPPSTQAANDAVTAAEVQRQSELKLKKQGEQLRASKDEVRLLKLEKQRLATHYDHFKKRLETENVKLKERLQKLLHDRNNERALGMKALNKIQSKDGASPSTCHAC